MDEQQNKDGVDEAKFFVKYVKDLCEENGSAFLDMLPLLLGTFGHRQENMLTYRDQCFTSLITGSVAPPPRLPFMEAFDDSLEAFLGETGKK